MGNPFASQTTQTIPLTFDPPHEATIRKLTGREYEQAQEAHMVGVLGGRLNVWAQRFRRILTTGLASDAEAQAMLRDPLTGFDRYALVRAGLVSWTYDAAPPVDPEALKTFDAAAARVKQVNDLTDEPVEFFALAILKLTKPALFVTAEEAMAEEKKAQAPSPVADREGAAAASAVSEPTV